MHSRPWPMSQVCTSVATAQGRTTGDWGGGLLGARREEAALLDQPQLCGVVSGDQLPVLLYSLSWGRPLPHLGLRPFPSEEGLGPPLPAPCI